MALSDEIKDKELEDIQDIDLSETRRKNIRIDGDNNRIIKLNVTDMGIFARLKEEYPKLKKYSDEAVAKLQEAEDSEDDESTLNALADLKSLDNKMRDSLDRIFDYHVSEVCAPSGTMYDPVNGKLRYEHIIEVLSGLYENNFKQEFAAMQSRVEKHTSKYIKPKK